MIVFDILSMTGFRIRFSSEDITETPENFRYMVEAYLPGADLSDPSNETPNQLVRFVESKIKTLVVSNQEILINDNWGGKVSLDLWHLLYSILRKEFLSRSLFSTHAACAGRERAVLLVGHSGTGKTTLMLKLVNDFGWKIFSGNKTVIDFSAGINAVAGTKTISIKESDLSGYANLRQTSVTYSNRSALFLDKEHYDVRDKVPISAICLIKVDGSAQQSTELTYPSSLHSLYPFFMDTVYADTVMCDAEAVYPGDPPAGTREALAKKLKGRLPSVKIITMLGPVDYLVSQVKNLI